MSRVKIEVTQQDIEKGVRSHADKCPVALAAKRAIPCEVLLAFSGALRITNGDDVSRIPTPLRVQNFIVAFDSREPVFPFTFEVEL